jgi:hypothetical protein
MAGCDISKGLDILACKNTVAGIRRLYLANWDDYDIVTSSEAESGHTVTDLGTLVGTGSTGVFQYEVKNDGNSYVETIESSRDNGTTVFNQVLTAVLTKLTAQKHFQVKMMAWGRIMVFIEFANNDILLMGIENGAEVTGTANVEGAMTGANNYQLTFTAMERQPSYFLTDDAVAQLKASVNPDNMDA